MIEKRRYPRIVLSEEITFSLNIHEFLETRRVEASGRIINKSEGGLCVVTDFPLEPGHVLIINDNEIGLVRWIKQDNFHYIAGILRKGRINGLSKD
ncbi:MAG: PilZ domain-containing protein [Thermodesulfovibrionales bacterium]|nr:PilZ domain-containing protein [Thermodesulfovibrionales bacterium]